MLVKQIEDGFYPALGTPTDEFGKLIESSYFREIELMIDSGASGVLCMGSMGKMASVRNNEYPGIAKQCVKAVSGRVPVMVGVMDCSVYRVLDRIDALNNLEITGVVATSPFYSILNPGRIKNFFRLLSEKSKYPVYIYDLPPVTQSPITLDILNYLMKMQNIKGIKTANLNLILDLSRNNLYRSDFSIFYSGLDAFDAAIQSGIRKNLDGMFTCTPFNSKKMYENFEENDNKKISYHLNNILTLRNIFSKEVVIAAYSYAMKLIGCPGNYHPDYDMEVSDKLKEEIYNCMKTIKEI
jgi:dihydrodipicolinate synthase/N-acetylneuraminate lyase